MADDRIRGIAADESGGAKSRTQRLVELFQRQADGAGAGGAPADARAAFVAQVQQLDRASAGQWSAAAVDQLYRLAGEALTLAEKAALAALPDNPFGQAQQVEALRSQLHQLLVSLNPPPEIVASPAFYELMEQLRPRTGKPEESDFSRQSQMKGKVRADVLNRQVHDAVTDADRRAAKQRVQRLSEAGANQTTVEHAARTLAQLARALKKKTRKKLKPGELDEVEDSAPVATAEEIKELADAALEVMKTLREELAPKWAPAQQPWFINAADNEVYAIILAVVPKELFAETEAWGEMQNLRAGQEVFSLRAADKTAEALRRK